MSNCSILDPTPSPYLPTRAIAKYNMSRVKVVYKSTISESVFEETANPVI